MIIKRKQDHQYYTSDVCGLLTEVLNTPDFENISIVTVENIKPTKGHYHKLSTEIYWVKEGKVSLDIYDAERQFPSAINLEEGDLVVIAPNTHHKVVEASNKNILFVISTPRWKKEDEFISDKI